MILFAKLFHPLIYHSRQILWYGGTQNFSVHSINKGSSSIGTSARVLNSYPYTLQKQGKVSPTKREWCKKHKDIFFFNLVSLKFSSQLFFSSIGPLNFILGISS